MKNLIIASTSSLYEEEYLSYLLPNIEILYKNCSEILFIPFARPSGISHEDYTLKVRVAFAKINISVVGLHEFDDKKQAVKNAKGIFTGGGNTFVLVSKLYEYQLIETLSEVIKKGTPYLGTSAGSNITGLSMQTTNDMPIVYPPSFKTLGIIPFNINPHFLDASANATHMGETRETRINEFHAYNHIPVLGLREGSWLEVTGNTITLKGNQKAKLFMPNKIPEELNPETDLSNLK